MVDPYIVIYDEVPNDDYTGLTMGPFPWNPDDEVEEMQPSFLDVLRHEMEQASKERLNRPGAFDVIYHPNRAERRRNNIRAGLKANGQPKH